MKSKIQEYIDIARKTNKERAREEEFSQASSNKVQDSVQAFTSALSNANQGSSKIAAEEGAEQKPVQDTDVSLFEAYLQDTNNTEEVIVGSKRRYPIQINDVVQKEFVVEWSIGTKAYWINVEESDDEEKINIVININHPFFKPYSNNEDFKIVLEKFVISFVVAEQQAKLTSDREGYIRASIIRHKMNEFLSKVSED